MVGDISPISQSYFAGEQLNQHPADRRIRRMCSTATGHLGGLWNDGQFDVGPVSYSSNTRDTVRS